MHLRIHWQVSMAILVKMEMKKENSTQVCVIGACLPMLQCCLGASPKQTGEYVSDSLGDKLGLLIIVWSAE